MISSAVLIIDDEQESRRQAEDILTEAGYEVTAATVEEATRAAEQTRFDLILAAAGEAPGTVFEMLESVQSADPDAVVVLVTEKDRLSADVAGFEARVDDVLVRPLNPEEMLLRIESGLEKRRLRQKIRRLRREPPLPEQVLEALQQGVVIADARQKDEPVIYANRAFSEMTGYSAKEIVGRNLRLLQGPETDPKAVSALGRCLGNGIEYSGEILHYRKDGSRFWNLLKIFPLRDMDGRPRYFIASMSDISRRMEVEASLQESEARFRQLTENIEDVFLLSAPTMEKVLYVSPSYQAIFGRPPGELYRSGENRLAAVHPNDRLKVMSVFGKPAAEKYEIEYRIHREDGKLRWIRERGFPIRNDDGKVFRVAGILSDITVEKVLREEADQRLQQIVQADRLAALGEVVAGVAHEINNPNSFITYNIPLLEETWGIFRPIVETYAAENPDKQDSHSSYAQLMDDMAEIVEAIKVGSERINRVVANLRDFARLDESGLTRPVDINEVIEKTLTIVGAQLRRCTDRIDMDLADDLPPVQGHAQKLEQVTANLLVNASHAVKEADGGRIRIATRYLERIDAVLVEVEDTGQGIEKGVIARIFEPFFTTRRPSGGTGLGLSVSYGLVKEHRGTIGVLSRPGAGSRFTIYLPVGEETEIDLHPTILCVDDDVSVLRMVRSMLINVEDEFVETTARPEQVLRYLETHPEIDIVLSDISMPEIDGWDLLTRIRRKFPLISVVLYSGHPDALIPPADVEERPDAVLHKPFEKFDLVQVLSTIGRQRL